MDDLRPTSEAPQEPARSSLLHLLRPSHQHSFGSAAMLLAASTALSAVMGLIRTQYVTHNFMSNGQSDVFNAAFEMPDMITYFLVGGSASITMVSMLSRFRKDEDDAGENFAISVILNSLLLVFTLGIVLAEIFAPHYTAWKFPDFTPQKIALCTSLTRIILPGQIFFFAGGVLGSRLLVRRVFIVQAITPLIYAASVVLGGVLFARFWGIYALAYGALAGMILGPFALNVLGALRTGFRWIPIVSLRHPLFREWLRLSLPLILGVTLVVADKWIQTRFASGIESAITLITVAKMLFNFPLNITGQATGAASLPFFAALHAKGEHEEFSRAVNRSASRVIAFSLLLTSWLAALSPLIVKLLFQNGRFSSTDAALGAQYFAILCLSLCMWSAQTIYARAFYATGDTVTPAVVGTVVTVLALPVYALLFHRFGMPGLMWASNLAMTGFVAWLVLRLQMKKLVHVAGLDKMEIGRSILASLCAWVAIKGVIATHLLAAPSRVVLALRIAVASAAWLGAGLLVLSVTGSKLPNQLLRRGK